jgi:hypothetical protein
MVVVILTAIWHIQPPLMEIFMRRNILRIVIPVLALYPLDTLVEKLLVVKGISKETSEERWK